MARKHNLHVMIDIRVKQQLQTLLWRSGCSSLSKFIRELLKLGRVSLKQYYFQADDQQSRYGLIDRDLSLARCSLHIYLDEAEYRWLKLIHQDLNFFSLAQIIRWLLRIVVELMEQGVVTMYRELLKMVNTWKKTERVIRYRIEKVVQLLSPDRLNPIDVRWISIYNRDFIPLRKFLIKT